MRGFRQPHNKVRFLASVLFTVLIAFALVTVQGLFDSRKSLDALVGKHLVAQGSLDDVDRNLLEAHIAISDGLKSTTDTQRIKAKETFDRAVVRARNGWDRFRTVAPSAPDITKHEAGYETMLGAWTELTTPLQLSIASGDVRSNTVRDQNELATRRFAVMRAQLTPLREQYAAHAVIGAAVDGRDTVDHTLLFGLLVFAIGVAIAFVVVRVTVRATMAQNREIERRDSQQRVEASRTEQESRLQRALEMARTEESALETLTLALDWLVPGTIAELLLADSSKAHVRQALTTDREHRGPGCPVGTPHDCPAVTRGQTLIYDDSTAFDACPQLRDRGIAPCSAVCVPVSIMGAPAGVLHTIGAPNEKPSPAHVQAVELAAARAGERMGLLRAFSQSQTQASTDPLTGLANRRSVEARIIELTREGIGYSVAYCDLDNFKTLNDKHGHDTGDRALRLFARTLRDSVRPSDIVGRWGGEEFVVDLPTTRANDAASALERVRESLALACTDSTVPTFTVSMGVADDEMGTDFAEVVDCADKALLAAKRNGRNRVVVAGSIESTKIESADSETCAVARPDPADLEIQAVEVAS